MEDTVFGLDALVCMEDTERTCLGVYGGHGTDLPWCVWRTQNGLALVLTLVRAQAEYRLAFAVSGIRDVTVECTDVTVVWWCDVLWERRGPVG